MEEEQDGKLGSWHQATVSWGQLIVAMLLGFVTIIGSVFLDRLTVDRRVTVVEERQQFVLKAIESDQRDVAMLRAEINRKLDMLQVGQQELMIQLTKHEASNRAVIDKKLNQ